MSKKISQLSDASALTGDEVAPLVQGAATKKASLVAQVTAGLTHAALGNAAIKALAALTPATNKIAYFTSSSAAALADFPEQARTFLAASTITAQRAALGLGSAALAAATDFANAAHTHIIGNITGLQAALDAKLNTSAVSTFALTILDDADGATVRATIGAGAQTVTVVTVAGNKTLALTDAETLQNVTAAATLSIPTNATAAFPTGTCIRPAKNTSAAVSISAVSGVTLNGVDGGSVILAEQYRSAVLTKVGTNAWLIEGSIA